MLDGYPSETLLLNEPGASLNEPKVLVTTVRFVVGVQSYPIADIASVAPFSEVPAMTGPNTALGLGLVVNLSAIVAIKMGVENRGGWLFVPAAIGSVAFVWGLYQARTRKVIHGVLLAMSGAHVRVSVASDQSRVHRVLGALNQAIASR